MKADAIFAFQLRNPIHNGHALLMQVCVLQQYYNRNSKLQFFSYIKLNLTYNRLGNLRVEFTNEDQWKYIFKLYFVFMECITL